MNWLDIVIVIISIIFGILGMWKGAIRVVFAIIGLIAGIALAGHYYMPFATLLSPSGAAWSGIAAYAIILIATFVVAGIIGWFVAKIVHVTILGWLDRLLGLVLGFAAGSMLCAAVLAILSKYLPGMETVIANSALARLLMDQFPLLLAFLPDEFDFISDFFLSPGQIY